jgi:capsular polysaccharide biosynthesis protein
MKIMLAEKMLNIAKNGLKTLILSGLFLAAFSFLFLVTTQKNFKATSDLLVVQNQQGFSDYYALSKSADYLTSVIVESAYSERFLEEVEASGNVTSKFLPDNKLDRLKEWSKMIKVSKNSASGMVHIEVFSNNQKQVVEISNAVINVLTTKHYVFLGRGQDIDIRILSGPIWEKNPEIKDLVVVILGGFFMGVILSFILMYYKEEKNDPNLYLEDLKRKIYESQNF